MYVLFFVKITVSKVKTIARLATTIMNSVPQEAKSIVYLVKGL